MEAGLNGWLASAAWWGSAISTSSTPCNWNLPQHEWIESKLPLRNLSAASAFEHGTTGTLREREAVSIVDHLVATLGTMNLNIELINLKLFWVLRAHARGVAERTGQPPEPAADDVGFVSGATGWLRLAAPPGSAPLNGTFVSRVVERKWRESSK
jgi:hypothetical protein